MAHQAGAYPGLSSMKRLEVFLLLPGRDSSSSQVPPAVNSPVAILLSTYAERDTVRVVSYLRTLRSAPARAQTHCKPGPHDRESSALTIRPPRLRELKIYLHSYLHVLANASTSP